MKDFAKMKPLSKNQLDDLTDGLVNAMRYSNPEFEYPEYDGAKPDDSVPAEWFYPIHNGTNSFSELTAIHMYVTQEATFDDIGELMLGIGMTEMKHYDKLSDFIKKLGGKIDQRFNNSGVTVGKDAVEALTIAIGAEKETIAFYEKIQTRLKEVTETKTVKIAFQLTSKLIADEEVHLELLKERLRLLADEETYKSIIDED
jgi:rubrerythrin